MRQNWLDNELNGEFDDQHQSDWELISDMWDQDELPPMSADFTDRVLAEVATDSTVSPRTNANRPIIARNSFAVWASVAAAVFLAFGLIQWNQSNSQSLEIASFVPDLELMRATEAEPIEEFVAASPTESDLELEALPETRVYPELVFVVFVWV